VENTVVNIAGGIIQSLISDCFIPSEKTVVNLLFVKSSVIGL
jgi:hypothetical protein